MMMIVIIIIIIIIIVIIIIIIRFKKVLLEHSNIFSARFTNIKLKKRYQTLNLSNQTPGSVLLLIAVSTINTINQSELK